MPPQQNLDQLGLLLRQVAASNRLGREECRALQENHPALVRHIVTGLDHSDAPYSEKLAAFIVRCDRGDVTPATLWGVL